MSCVYRLIIKPYRKQRNTVFPMKPVTCGHLWIENRNSEPKLPIDWPHWMCVPLFTQEKKTFITSFYKLIRPKLIYSIVRLFFWCVFFTARFLVVAATRACLMLKMYANERAMSSCNDMEIKLMIEYFTMVCVLFGSFSTVIKLLWLFEYNRSSGSMEL